MKLEIKNPLVEALLIDPTNLIRHTKNYLYLCDPSLKFNASDALSLAMLLRGSDLDKDHAMFYRSAYESVCHGLKLSKEGSSLLTQSFNDSYISLDVVMGAEDMEPGSKIYCLLELRQSLIHFQRTVYATNDVWGTSIKKDKALDDVINWQTHASDNTLDGMVYLDVAICELLDWDISKQISFEKLRSKFSYPVFS